MKKLNIGCGKYLKEGCVNVDLYGSPDVKHDLNRTPWPFKDGEFDEVYAFHVIEHLDSPLEFFNEIHRILKDGGKAIIKCPHYSYHTAYANFGHKRFFHEDAIDTITTSEMSDLSAERKFKLIKKQVRRGRIFFWKKKEIIWIIQK